MKILLLSMIFSETSFGYVFNVVFPLSTQWVQSTGSLQEILILVELFDHLVGLALKELNYRKRFLIILAFYSQVTDIVFFSTLFILLTSSTPLTSLFFGKSLLPPPCRKKQVTQAMKGHYEVSLSLFDDRFYLLRCFLV